MATQMYRGSKFLVTIRPTLALTSIFSSGTTHAAYTADDILFDWTAFNFPKYPFAAKLISVTTTIQGADATRVEEPINLFFAQANPDGTAPPQLGPEHDAITTPANGGPYRNILGAVSVVAADADDVIPFHAFSQTTAGPTSDLNSPNIILGSEALTSNNHLPGKLYVCGQAVATPEFATGCALDMGSGQAATTTSTTITVKTQDPRKIFSIGDTIHAHDGAEVGVLTGFGDANGDDKDTKLTFGGGIVEELADDDELINLQPITIRLAFEA